MRCTVSGLPSQADTATKIVAHLSEDKVKVKLYWKETPSLCGKNAAALVKYIYSTRRVEFRVEGVGKAVVVAHHLTSSPSTGDAHFVRTLLVIEANIVDESVIKEQSKSCGVTGLPPEAATATQMHATITHFTTSNEFGPGLTINGVMVYSDVEVRLTWYHSGYWGDSDRKAKALMYALETSARGIIVDRQHYAKITDASLSTTHTLSGQTTIVTIKARIEHNQPEEPTIEGVDYSDLHVTKVTFRPGPEPAERPDGVFISLRAALIFEWVRPVDGPSAFPMSHLLTQRLVAESKPPVLTINGKRWAAERGHTEGKRVEGNTAHTKTTISLREVLHVTDSTGPSVSGLRFTTPPNKITCELRKVPPTRTIHRNGVCGYAPVVFTMPDPSEPDIATIKVEWYGVRGGLAADSFMDKEFLVDGRSARMTRYSPDLREGTRMVFTYEIEALVLPNRPPQEISVGEGVLKTDPRLVGRKHTIETDFDSCPCGSNRLAIYTDHTQDIEKWLAEYGEATRGLPWMAEEGDSVLCCDCGEVGVFQTYDLEDSFVEWQE